MLKTINSISLFLIIILVSCFCGCQSSPETPLLLRSFDGGYGQLEVGGPFAGAEFHKSQPLPARISFYYPAANSLDLSTDYWERYNSQPLKMVLNTAAGSDTLGTTAWAYEYAPYFVNFHTEQNGYAIDLSYRFGKELPFMAVELKINGKPDSPPLLSVDVSWDLSLRTCHSYRWVQDVEQEASSYTDLAVSYPDSGAADAALFIVNISENEIHRNILAAEHPQVNFNFEAVDSNKSTFQLVQLIGMCETEELESMLATVRQNWQIDVQAYEDFVLNYTQAQRFVVADPDLQETVIWSKAIQATNRHFIDGQIMPMPCPAEYNFFFTHDMLLTGQGVVNYDLNFLSDGFKWILEHTQADNVIPHAYYWREGEFVTEYCNSDNWNHLWFIISTASYLKHSADVSLVDSLYPLLERSLELMSENLGDDGLMYAQRPDWWDIGNVYGPRSYITVLMSKALQDFVYISQTLGNNLESLPEHLKLAQQLKIQLTARLWNEDAGYLMNILDEEEIDPHYYTGSMLAVVYDMLNPVKSKTLLKTVKAVLLDENLGVRNAMPPDFHLLGERYHFQGNEAGDQWVYFNGGIWPQGNAWYVKALHANGQAEEALRVLKKFMTIAGTLDSPNGLPSFYEYRRTDPDSPRYGEIDKPSFLWAGGFYLQSLYQLAGARENQWNQYLDVNIPAALREAEFDLTINGKLCRIQNKGDGDWFERIDVDGVQLPSAVITTAGDHMLVKRGKLIAPYLAQADCKIIAVNLNKNIMSLGVEGIPGQTFQLTLASPQTISRAVQIQTSESTDLEVIALQDGYFGVRGFLKQGGSRIELVFKDRE